MGWVGLGQGPPCHFETSDGTLRCDETSELAEVGCRICPLELLSNFLRSVVVGDVNLDFEMMMENPKGTRGFPQVCLLAPRENPSSQ